MLFMKLLQLDILNVDPKLSFLQSAATQKFAKQILIDASCVSSQ